MNIGISDHSMARLCLAAVSSTAFRENEIFSGCQG